MLRYCYFNSDYGTSLAGKSIGLALTEAKIQGRNESVLTVTDKLGSFQLKLNLWRKKIEEGVMEMFSLTEALVAWTDELPVLKECIRTHLIILQQKLSHYFSDLNISHCDWVRNPFNKSAIEAAYFVNHVAQEQMLEMRMDRTLQLKHNEMDLASFWIISQHKYPDIVARAIHVLLPFATTYLCKLVFSSLL